MTKGVWVHFLVFNSIPLIFLPVSVPIPCTFLNLYCSVRQIEIRDGFPYPWFFCYSIWICTFLFLILWRIEMEFWRDCIEFVECFWQDCHFTILTLPTHEHGRSFHLLRSSLISFFRDLKFLSYRSFTCLVRCTPRYLTLFMSIVKGVISLISLPVCLFFQ